MNMAFILYSFLLLKLTCCCNFPHKFWWGLYILWTRLHQSTGTFKCLLYLLWKISWYKPCCNILHYLQRNWIWLLKKKVRYRWWDVKGEVMPVLKHCIMKMEKLAQHILCRKLDGPQSQSGCCANVKKILVLQGVELHSLVQPIV
jgi:hypothetical protein